jgi:hypothetical protein
VNQDCFLAQEMVFKKNSSYVAVFFSSLTRDGIRGTGIALGKIKEDIP